MKKKTRMTENKALSMVIKWHDTKLSNKNVKLTYPLEYQKEFLFQNKFSKVFLTSEFWCLNM